jgi:hypothetical protein
VSILLKCLSRGDSMNSGPRVPARPSALPTHRAMADPAMGEPIDICDRIPRDHQREALSASWVGRESGVGHGRDAVESRLDESIEQVLAAFAMLGGDR